MEIRKLKRKDRVTLAELIKKFASVTDMEALVNLVADSKSTDPDKGDTAQILDSAFRLFNEMLKVIEEDVSEWFAGLLQVTREEYDDLSVDIEMLVIEQILNQDGFVSFFDTGSRVLNKIKNLRTRSEN